MERWSSSLELEQLAEKQASFHPLRHLQGHPVWSALLLAFGLSAVIAFPMLSVISAPYGKHWRKGFGGTVDGRLGWLLQEIISPIFLVAGFSGGPGRLLGAPPLPQAPFPAPVHVFVGLWILHYLHRAVVYPLRRSMSPSTAAVVAAAVAFNVVNGLLVGSELAMAAAAGRYTWPALAQASQASQVALGLTLFVLGAVVNLESDARLLALRRRPADARRHFLPSGGLFDYCCCPHYLGECIEWAGFAIATGTVSGAVFALWTIANLGPRAVSTREWYREKFRGQLPPGRAALVPFLW